MALRAHEQTHVADSVSLYMLMETDEHTLEQHTEINFRNLFAALLTRVRSSQKGTRVVSWCNQ